MVQGQKALVAQYLELQSRDSADALFLTYDEEMEGAFFYPESTWAQGRNRLLEEALKRDEYLYYIFCDDDIEFRQGAWSLFEEQLEKYIPAIGVPVFPRTKPNVLKFPKFSAQPFFINDEQLIAFHRDVVHDRIIVPYQTRFDALNWWASCEIQQILIQNFYSQGALQFNSIVIDNVCKERYSQQHESDKTFRDAVISWIGKQFVGTYKLTAHYHPPRLYQILWRFMVYKFRHAVGMSTFRVSSETMKRKLLGGSDLYHQTSNN